MTAEDLSWCQSIALSLTERWYLYHEKGFKRDVAFVADGVYGGFTL